ncbi:hypothetical protein WICPIJ_007528 [Wickerhamomyces pijperi]|uniref:Uncharacterized protein n=1 Tax=Wickerhamomyces pijperi TaxID=599730 RepID=A0A9P8Q1H8_WICPI|nr:hypothetical protein WICPIJ_007528 [Wickerhamomyces pijperi]
MHNSQGIDLGSTGHDQHLAIVRELQGGNRSDQMVQSAQWALDVLGSVVDVHDTTGGPNSDVLVVLAAQLDLRDADTGLVIPFSNHLLGFHVELPDFTNGVGNDDEAFVMGKVKVH